MDKTFINKSIILIIMLGLICGCTKPTINIPTSTPLPTYTPYPTTTPVATYTTLPIRTYIPTTTVGISPNQTSTITTGPNNSTLESKPTVFTRSDCNNLSIDWRATPSPEGESNDYHASIPVSITSQLTKENIAFALCCQYIEKYLSPSTEIRKRIEDYRIWVTRVEYLEDNKRDIVVCVQFEVLPTDLSSTYWIAGAADYIGNGWIINSSYASIDERDGYYVIIGFWNG